MSQDTEIVQLAELSESLNLTKGWLLSEAKAGRIPSFKAGNRRVFNLPLVRRVIAERASPYSWEPKLLASQLAISSILDDSDRSDNPDQARWELALHEAGHAVVALAFGHQPASLHLWSEGIGACICNIRDSVCPEMIAAGPIAQKLFANEPRPQQAAGELYTPSRYQQSARSPNDDSIAMGEDALPRVFIDIPDEDRLRNWASSYCARNPYHWAKRLAENDRRAQAELEAHKASVLNLARALYLCGELEGDDIKNAMYLPGGKEPEFAIKPARTPESKPAEIDAKAEQVALLACLADLAGRATRGST